MSAEAIGRVPFSDWLMAVAVVACGVVAIAATWRVTRFTTLIGDSGEGGVGDEHRPQLALPPGGPNELLELDDFDRALWELIEGEYARRPQAPPPRRDDVVIPARTARELAA